MWNPCSHVHVLLWFLWSKVGQGREAKLQCQVQSQKRSPTCKIRRIRSSRKQCIRRRLCSSIRRCTVCTVSAAAVCTAIAYASFASVLTAEFQHPRDNCQTVEDPSAPEGQSDWKSRGQNNKTAECSGYYATELACIRSQHAEDCSAETSRMCELSNCSQCGNRATKVRAPCTPDTEARRSCSAHAHATDSDAARPGSAKFACFGCQCTCKPFTPTNICPSTKYYGGRSRVPAHCTCHESRFPSTRISSKFATEHACTNPTSQKLSECASTDAHAASQSYQFDRTQFCPDWPKSTSTMPCTAWKLGLATCATSVSPNASVAASGSLATGTVHAASSTSFASIHARTCQDAHSASASRSTQYGAIDCCSQPSQSRPVAIAGNSSQRAERSISRARWSGRARVECISCPTTGTICPPAESMSRSADPIQQQHAHVWQPTTCRNRESTTSQRPCGASRTVSGPTPGHRDNRCPRACRFADMCHATGPDVWFHGTRDLVYPQFSTQESDGRPSGSTEILHVPQRSATDENTQAPARAYLCPAENGSRSASALIRWKSLSDTSAHRDTIRCRATSRSALAAVGIGNCGGPIGSSALPAENDRADPAIELPQSLTTGPTILFLDEAIPMTDKEASMHYVRELYPMLCKPWPETSMLWGQSFVHLLPDLEPDIRELIASCPTWSGEEVLEVHLYIDGSSFVNRQQPNDIHAAWAFIIVVKIRTDCNDSYMIYAATSHQLSSASMSSHQFHGVGEIGNDALSAEAAGMLVCLAWIAQSPFEVVHVVHYDNATIGQFAAGEIVWNASWEHSQLKSNLTAMRHCLQSRRKAVLFQHVKAHQGDPLNETADALAKSTAKGIVLNMPIPKEVSMVMLNRNFPLAWMTLSPASTIPLPYALPGLFKAEGPTSSLPPDTTWHHVQSEEVKQDAVIGLHLASANVLTLAPGAKALQAKGLMTKGRTHLLQAQFHQARANVIGIQESRTQAQITRHNDTHLVFQSGASEEGSRGCELWLDKTIPYATSANEKFYFQHHQVHIALANDRSLLAVIKAPHLHMRIMVLHAPHQAAKDESYDAWWNHIQAIVQKVCPHLPIIILGDMNAKLGSVCSEAVDSLGAEEESITGHALHSFMLECQLWAPSTFEQHHTGPSFTWISSEGAAHRLDFILIPSAWKGFDIHSKMMQDVDLCTTRDDHMPISLEVRMSKSQSTYAKSTRCRIDVRKCTEPALQQQFIAYLQSPPHIPWEIGTGEHAEILTQWLQTGARQSFKPSKHQPRQKYLSELTWNIVQSRKQLLKLMHNAEHHVHSILLVQVFRAWQQATTVGHAQVDTQPILWKLRHKCQQVFAWALHQRKCLHPAARHSSRHDRVLAAQETIDQFLEAAQGHNSRALYRKLQLILGQTHRRKTNHFSPIPAVRMPDNTLAQDADIAAERWRAHFAEAEQGCLTTVSQMQLQATCKKPLIHDREIPFDMASLPTLESIETYIKRSKIRKSPGIDGLPSEVYRIQPNLIASILWPLFSKCAVRCNEPLRWKGGEVCSIPKRPKAGHQVDNFRSILLADYVSKINHGLVRQRLLPSMIGFRHNMQAGGVPKFGTDMLHLYITSFAQYTRQVGSSSALLFVDIKQAFYRACRSLLVHQDIHESHLVQLFAQNGWSSDMYSQFRQRLAEPTALAQASVSPHLEAQVASMLTHTWFQLRQCPSTLTQTGCGTHPGDSIADLLYAFIMSRFIHVLRDKFCEFGLDTALELKWMPFGVFQSGEVEPQRLIEACWVDDLVLLLQVERPDTLIAKIKTAVSLTQDIAVEHGLMLNYGPDKTAVLLALRGDQSQAVKQSLYCSQTDRTQLEFQCNSLTEPGKLDVVATYVYLGQVQDLQGHQGSEVRRRFLLSQATSRILRKNIFASPKMPQKTRKQLFQSLVISKLTYGAGAWQPLHIHTARSWHSQVMKMYVQIVARIQPGPNHFHLDTLAQCALPHPMLLLTNQRFSLFDRLVDSDMGELFALLQAQSHDQGWLTLIVHDLLRLSRTCPPHPVFEMAANDDITAIAQHCLSHPKALSKIAKWAHKHHLASHQMWQIFRTFQAKFEDDAIAYGFDWTFSTAPQQADAQFSCHACNAAFSTYKALCTHMYKKHDALNVVHNYCASNTCKSCLKVYHSREQVIHHLRYKRTGCLVHLMATTQPMPQEEVAAILLEQSQAAKQSRKQERNTTHKLPVVQSKGPRRPWPWHKHSSLFIQDTRDPPTVPILDCDQWVQDVLQHCHDHDVAQAFSTLMTHEYHGTLAATVVARFQGLDTPDAAHKLEAYITLQEAIALWQESHGLAAHGNALATSSSATLDALHSIRHNPQPQVTEDLPVHMRRQLIIDQMWLEDSVDWQIRRQLYKERCKIYTSVRASSPPFVQSPIFLYIFSGRRREGDFQSHLETILRNQGLSGKILMIDLALSDSHDVGREAFENMILDWIRNGFVAGILIAPPCETWSEARYMVTDRDHDPKPIRTAADPFGFATLSTKEWEQICISSFLLFVTLRIMFAAATHSVAAILEHPREPKKADRAAIWRLPWMVFLETMCGMERRIIWQGAYMELALQSQPTLELYTCQNSGQC